MKNLVNNIPVRSRQAIPDLLDLSGFYTHAIVEDWLPLAGANLKALATGVKAHAKSVFDIRGLIHLGGLNLEGPSSVRIEVESIEFVSNNQDVVPFVIGITVERNNPIYEWFDSIRIGAYNPIIPRSLEATSDQVDLTKFYGASLDDDWFNHSSHDLHDVPKGIQSMAGTKFDVRGLIVLGGSGSLEITGLALPEAVSGIPVNRMCKRIHFLHACGFSAPRGTQVGKYVIHYANGLRKAPPSSMASISSIGGGVTS